MSASKITGEEERYSRTDLVDFEANVQGAQAAFDAVKPILADEERRAGAEIDDQVRGGRRRARAVPDRHHLRGLHRTSPRPTPRRSSQVIDALAEPLSKVAKQVVGS